MQRTTETCAQVRVSKVSVVTVRSGAQPRRGAYTTGYSQAVAVIPSLQKTYTEPLSLSDTRLTHHHPPSASYIWLSGYQFTDISPITGATALARARPWRICAGFWAQPLVLPNLGGQTPSWTGPGLTLQHRCLNNQDPSKKSESRETGS